MSTFDEMSDDELRDFAREHKIPRAGRKKRETLLLELRELVGEPEPTPPIEEPPALDDDAADATASLDALMPGDDEGPEPSEPEIEVVVEPEPPKAFKLSNDVTIVNNGMLATVRAGTIVRQGTFDVGKIRAAGGRLVEV
jgi:hypothetical protein